MISNPIEPNAPALCVNGLLQNSNYTSYEEWLKYRIIRYINSVNFGSNLILLNY